MKQFKINDIVSIGRIDYVVTKRTNNYVTLVYKNESYVFDSMKRKIHVIDNVEYIKTYNNNLCFAQ